MSTEKKYIRRHLPCHPYDVEGIESWLTDMAQNGYALAKVPVRFGFLLFRKDEPRDISYRLEASPRGEGIWSDAGKPEEQAIEISEKYGWEFVVKCGAFYIYRSLKPHTRELNTDPEVQALSLKALINNKLKSLFPVILWLIILAAALIKKGLPAVIEAPFLTWILLSAVILLNLINTVSEIIHIRRLQKALRKNGTLNHRKKVKKHAFLYFLSSSLPFLLAVLMLIMVLYVFLPPKSTAENYNIDPPFATVEDFFAEEKPNNDYLLTDESYTDVGQWRSLISPKNVYWHEQTQAKDKGGNETSVSLTVNYHEMINEALGRKTAEDYYRYDNKKDDMQEIELSGIEADYIKAYKRPSGYITVIIQKGNKVIYASFCYTPSDQNEYVNPWVKVLAKSIEA